MVLSGSGSGITRYSSLVKPIRYLKANATEVLTHLAERREPLVITQNGGAKAVLQDLASYEDLILDGRRDMQSVLARRLLGA